MARKEQSQFDDAFEDAESDMLNPKTILPAGPAPYIQRNGHVTSGREEVAEHDGTNGELPESDTGGDVGEDKVEDEWNGHPEDMEENEGEEDARMYEQQVLAPEEDGQDEYGDTFFMDQGDRGVQGMGYNSSSYQYSEGDDGTREGTEDSGQGQIRDDLTESDKDKDYIEDITQENRRDVYDRDDHCEDSGVVDDNGLGDTDSGMQGYEAEEDGGDDEDRFEEVDFRYEYMDGNSYVERQSYGERQQYAERKSYVESEQYVEDNPAYNGSEHEYDPSRDVIQKDDMYEEYTESDLPDAASHSLKDVPKEQARDTAMYEQDQVEKEEQMHGHDVNDQSRIGDQMNSDYVIVDRDVLPPKENSRYAASESAEADQENQLHTAQETYDYLNNSSLNKAKVQSTDQYKYIPSYKSDEISSYQSDVYHAFSRIGSDRKVEENQHSDDTNEMGLRQHGAGIAPSGQSRISPVPDSSQQKGMKDSWSKGPRRPAPGAAQSVQQIPGSAGNSKTMASSSHQMPAYQPYQQTKTPSPAGSPHDSDEYEAGRGDVMSRRSQRPQTQSARDGATGQEKRSWSDGVGKSTSGDRMRSMPLPGGAQPVSVLKSRLLEEKRKMNEIEQNLASTTIQQDTRRTQNRNVKRTSGPGERPKEGSMSSRHTAEYASLSSLSASASRLQGGPSNQTAHEKESYSHKGSARSSSSSPEEMKKVKSGQREQPRNNSNANHLNRDSVERRPNHNSRQQSQPKQHSYDSEERSDSASGEIVFDDFAECGAYLKDKDGKPSPLKVKSRQGKKKSPVELDDDGARRRRNSYELANRSSSEDSDHELEKKAKAGGERGDLDLQGLNTQGSNLFGSGQRGPGMNSSLLSQLAERELASLRNSYKKPQEEVKEVPRGSQSTTSTTSSTASTPKDGPRKVLPNLSPMEYDAVGFRLAGHSGIGESTLNLSTVQPQPGHVEEDQFSDAEEDGSEPVYPPTQTNPNPNANAPGHYYEPEQQQHPSPMYGKRPLEDSGQQMMSQMPSHQQYCEQQGMSPTDQVDVDEAMKELNSALSSTKSRLMKTPSFYTPEQRPVWILQPDAAKRHDEDQKRTRVMEDRRRRNEEMRRSHVQQRAEFMKRTDPQCYVRNEDDEDEDEDQGLMSQPEQKMGAQDYTNKQRPSSRGADPMRAPDLPPTTGKIKDALGRGIIYPAAYLGSTQLVTTKQPTKKVRMQQAQEAVNRIKSPEGEEQPSTEVDLAISNERIRVLNADTQETMMDHPLKTISYIADIGNIIVIMARRRQVSRTLDEAMEESGVMLDSEGRRQPRKIICHVFETEDAQLIAQTIGQAFALAYLEFLKANGIEDPHAQEIDYHDVLNSQEIYGDDLMLFSNKECEKEVLIEKERSEIMGMVVVESGWGSLIPTVVIANMSPFGAAARSGKLNIGDQVMSINGTSLVGLPLTQCQQTIKGLRSQCLVKFNVVSCPPVTQVLIKRPDTKYQLGFSVQNGIICSLMRGGIAERGGVRVGHRIIEINGSSVVATAHEKIVEMLSTSVGEIRMKTMPLSMYKLLTGQEQPVYI